MGINIKDKHGKSWVYYSLSNLQELINKYSLGVYTDDMLYDGVLFLECDSKCKILPLE